MTREEGGVKRLRDGGSNFCGSTGRREGVKATSEFRKGHSQGSLKNRGVLEKNAKGSGNQTQKSKKH